MRCLHPVDTTHGFVKCGQCMPCRVAKRREWTGKIIQEHVSYGISSFVTLTYSDERLPTTVTGIPTLVKGDLNEFRGRLREKVLRNFRYFACGEYGSKTKRPHYHIALFGCDFARYSEDISSAWEQGYTSISPLNSTRCGYIAGYCTKKLTRSGDFRLDDNQAPEFANYSQRPAIGGRYVDATIDYYLSRKGAAALAAAGDISHVFRHEGKLYPFSQYAIRKIRKGVGLPEKTSDLRKIRPEAFPVKEAPDLDEMKSRWRKYFAQEERRKIFTQATAHI